MTFLVSTFGVDNGGPDGTKAGASTFRWNALEVVAAVVAVVEEVEEDFNAEEVEEVKGVAERLAIWEGPTPGAVWTEDKWMEEEEEEEEEVVETEAGMEFEGEGWFAVEGVKFFPPFFSLSDRAFPLFNTVV